jgi:hypothetical protein
VRAPLRSYRSDLEEDSGDGEGLILCEGVAQAIKKAGHEPFHGRMVKGGENWYGACVFTMDSAVLGLGLSGCENWYGACVFTMDSAVLGLGLSGCENWYSACVFRQQFAHSRSAIEVHAFAPPLEARACVWPMSFLSGHRVATASSRFTLLYITPRALKATYLVRRHA